jgi:hypothetical protein
MAEHTHEYDCIVCGAHFDRQDDLADHNQREHIANATGNERPRTDKRDEPDNREEDRRS